MGVGHAGGEFKALIDAVSLLLLHAHSVVLGLGVLLCISFVHRDFTDDLVSELLQDSVKEELDVLTRLGRFLLNPLDNLPALLFLGLEEVVYILVLSSLARIHESVAAHVEHELAMLEQVLAEVVPQDEELLVKGVYRLHLVVQLDLLLPHAHELPRLELLEEGEVLDVIVGVSFNEPLTERHELLGRVLLVEG